MKIKGEYRFDAPREVVWDALRDPTVLASVLPGCEKLDQVGEEAYEGTLNIKVGPVQGRFEGKIQLEDVEPPTGYTMKVDGRGAPGFVKATGRLKLAEEGEATLLTYDSDAQVGGRIAGVGQRLLDSSAKAIIKQSLEGLNSSLAARAEGEEAEEAPAPEAPSQADFAVEVAKEVARDLVPKWVWIVGGALLLVLILLLLFA